MQFTVDGVSYTLQPYVTSHGLKLLTDITKLVGADLLALVMEMKDLLKGDEKPSVEDLLDMDVDTVALQRIMGTFLDRVQTDTLDELFKRILVGTLIDSLGSTTAAQAYDAHFAQKYTHLFTVVWKSLQGQYGDFLHALGGKVASSGAKVLATKPKQRVSKPGLSAGQSGG